MVYFVQGEQTGYIKIGMAANVQARMRALQQASPDRLRLLGIMRGGSRKEASLHRRFEHARSHGEWFRPTDDLCAYIGEYATPPQGDARIESMPVPPTDIPRGAAGKGARWTVTPGVLQRFGEWDEQHPGVLLVTVETCADIFGLPVETVLYLLEHDGTIHSIEKGRNRRIIVEDIENLLDEQPRASTLRCEACGGTGVLRLAEAV